MIVQDLYIPTSYVLFVLTVSIEKGILTENLLSLLKPIKCGFCEERFPDQLTSERHVKKIHSKGQQEPSFKELVPATMNVNQLKVELRKSTVNQENFLHVFVKIFMVFNSCFDNKCTDLYTVCIGYTPRARLLSDLATECHRHEVAKSLDNQARGVQPACTMTTQNSKNQVDK